MTAPSPEQLAEWERLAGEATGHAWSVGTLRSGVLIVWTEDGRWVATAGEGQMAGADAAFIAASREAVPTLLAEVRRLRDEMAVHATDVAYETYAEVRDAADEAEAEVRRLRESLEWMREEVGSMISISSLGVALTPESLYPLRERIIEVLAAHRERRAEQERKP